MQTSSQSNWQQMSKNEFYVAERGQKKILINSFAIIIRRVQLSWPCSGLYIVKIFNAFETSIRQRVYQIHTKEKPSVPTTEGRGWKKSPVADSVIKQYVTEFRASKKKKTLSSPERHSYVCKFFLSFSIQLIVVHSYIHQWLVIYVCFRK